METLVFVGKVVMIIWCVIHFGIFFLGTLANYAMLSMVKKGKLPPVSTIENVIKTHSAGVVKLVNPRLAFLFIGSWLAWGVMAAIALYLCSISAAMIFVNSMAPLAKEIMHRGLHLNKETFNA